VEPLRDLTETVVRSEISEIRVFATVLSLYPSLLFAGKEPTREEPLTRLHPNGRLLALPVNIKKGGIGIHSSLSQYSKNYGRKKVLHYSPLVSSPLKPTLPGTRVTKPSSLLFSAIS
jgi:hypothetical protein